MVFYTIGLEGTDEDIQNMVAVISEVDENFEGDETDNEYDFMEDGNEELARDDFEQMAINMAKAAPSAFFTMSGDESIPDGITKIDEYAFGKHKELKSITLPESVKQIGEGSFYLCAGLEKINIPESVTKIGREAFAGCINLKTIEIPSTVEKIGEVAFYDCKQLTIIGESGSCAEEYSQKNGIPFKSK